MEQYETGERARAHASGSRNRGAGICPAPNYPPPRRESPQAQHAEGDSVTDNMELILLSIAGTMTLLLVELLAFVHRGHATELASSIRAIPRLLSRNETLTATVPVASICGG